jgi:hypothetical protein
MTTNSGSWERKTDQQQRPKVRRPTEGRPLRRWQAARIGTFSTASKKTLSEVYGIAGAARIEIEAAQSSGLDLAELAEERRAGF